MMNGDKDTDDDRPRKLRRLNPVDSSDIVGIDYGREDCSNGEDKDKEEDPSIPEQM